MYLITLQIITIHTTAPLLCNLIYKYLTGVVLKMSEFFICKYHTYDKKLCLEQIDFREITLLPLRSIVSPFLCIL